MKTYSFDGGKIKVQHKVEGDNHKMYLEIVGVGKTESPWQPTSLPITWENMGGTIHLVAQKLTTRLPSVFQIVCEDMHQLEIMTS